MKRDVLPTPPFALFENRRAPSDSAGCHLFWAPAEHIQAHTADELPRALERLDACLGRGHFLCGYVTYEAGYVLVAKATAFALTNFHARSLPLLSFFAFGEHRTLDSAAADDLLRGLVGRSRVHDLTFAETPDGYRAKIDRIQRYIGAGDTYQVNYTFKCRLRYEGAPASLYADLRDRQRVEYAAYLDFPEARVMSLSPELFLRKRGDRLESKPMKGTAARGITPEEDRAAVRALKTCPKTQSEHVMIVDLLRSDLGRVAASGSVRVDGLFEVQSFETVHQMVSTVSAAVPRGSSVAEALRALFPCGSVTGAPKVRTMQIIEELETEPRGVYTGAVGYGMPGGDFCFNVPIRTLVSTTDGVAELGLGSGIVAESRWEDELAECLLKARFLTGSSQTFHLIESIRVDEGAIPAARLGLHLSRLEASARCFGFRWDRGRVEDAIRGVLRGLDLGAYKLRLALHPDGAVVTSSAALPSVPDDERRFVAVSPREVHSRSVFRYHKTSVRDLYDQEFARAEALGLYDVLFCNERGELAECSRHNVFLEIGGEWLTPPVGAGILDGVQRRIVLAEPAFRAREAVLFPRDLLRADRIWLTNAVRGIVGVELDAARRL